MESEPAIKKTEHKKRNPRPRKGPTKEKPPPVPAVASLIFNLLVATGLATALIRKEWASCSCVPVKVNVVFVALVVAFFLQLVWRYLGEVIKVGRGNVRTPWLRVSLDGVFAVLDALHFARWPTWALWIATGTAVIVALLCLGPLSPFRNPEMPPVVDGFLVGRPDSAEALVSPGSTIEAQLGTALKITPRISGRDEAHCTWFVDQGGFSAVYGCTVIYLAPLDSTIDNLSVRVQSTCQTQNSFASLGIRLTSDQL